MKSIRPVDRKRREKILDVLEKLSDYSSRGIPILVEGKNDQNALRELGVGGRIVRIRQRKKKLFELAEELSSNKTVIILSDFDQEGEELALELSRQFQYWGVQPVMRNEIRNAISWATRQIEGLNKIKGLREHLNNKQFIINTS